MSFVEWILLKRHQAVSAHPEISLQELSAPQCKREERLKTHGNRATLRRPPRIIWGGISNNSYAVKTRPNEGFSFCLPLLQARRTKNAFARPREEERAATRRRMDLSPFRHPQYVSALDRGKEEAKSARRRGKVSSLKNKR